MMRFRNTFNRILVVIAALVLMVALVSILIFPGVILTTVGEWMLAWGQVFQNGLQWPDIAISALVALLVVFLLALVIYWEVRSRRGEFVRVQRVNGGMAKVSTDSAKEMLEHRLRFVPGVVNIDSQVRARKNRVGVQVQADVIRGTNVPEAANQIIKETQRVFSDDLGLQINGAPEVSVTVVEEGTAAERRDEAEPSTQPTSYTAVPPATESTAGERQRDRERQRERQRKLDHEQEPIHVGEQRTPVVPESPPVEEGTWRVPETEERLHREAEQQEPMKVDEDRHSSASDRNYEDLSAYEQRKVEREEDEEYRPLGPERSDPYDSGKEIRTH
jgi:hypothetical protein